MLLSTIFVICSYVFLKAFIIFFFISLFLYFYQLNLYSLFLQVLWFEIKNKSHIIQQSRFYLLSYVIQDLRTVVNHDVWSAAHQIFVTSKAADRQVNKLTS